MDKFTILSFTLIFASTTSTIINRIGPLGILPLILPPVLSNPFDVSHKYSNHLPNDEQSIVFPDSSNNLGQSNLANQFRPTPSYSYEIVANLEERSKHQQRVQAVQSSQLKPDLGVQNNQHGPNQGVQNNQLGPNQGVQNNQFRPSQQTAQTVYGQHDQTQNYMQDNQAQSAYGQNQRVPEQNKQGQHFEQNVQNFAEKTPNNVNTAPVTGLNNLRPPQASVGNFVGLSAPTQAPQGVAGAAGTNTIFTSLTSFGLELMKAIDETQKGNAVVSPFSIALVLALLQQGTEGNAQVQINNALHMNPLEARNNFRTIVTHLHNRRSRNILNIATNIFVNEDYAITPQYKTYANQYFGSDLTSMNFKNSQLASKQINNWVSETTYGNIPYLVSSDTFDSDTQLVLANAMYFKGLWNSTFNSQRTVSRPFTLGTGEAKMASFMHNSGKFQGGKDRKLDVDWLIMPFEGFQYSLIALVPAVENGVTSLLQRLTTDDILGYLRVQERDVIISMPKFKVRIDTDLERPLNALGIRDIFTSKSGLTSLVSTRGDRPRVSGALHAAVLSIDEQGGSAAAATVLAVSTLSLDTDENEFRFKADRPFVIMLWDSELNVPLFVGKISDPTIVN